MPLTSYDHYTIRAGDFEKTVGFYSEVMGLRAERADDFAFPFCRLFLGDVAMVDVLGAGQALDDFLGRPAPAYQDGPERGTGNFEHVAFNATGIDDFMAKLDAADVTYVDRSLESHGVRQLLFDDPDGLEIEVNFPIDG